MVGAERLHDHHLQHGREAGRRVALRHARPGPRLPEQDHLSRGRETRAPRLQARWREGSRAGEFPGDGDLHGAGRQDPGRHAHGLPDGQRARLRYQDLRRRRGVEPDPGTPRGISGGVVVSTDRRSFLKAAAASAALALPAVAAAQSPRVAPTPDETGRRKRPASGGGVSKTRLARMHEAMARHFFPGFWDHRGWGFGMATSPGATTWPGRSEPTAGTAATAPPGKMTSAHV